MHLAEETGRIVEIGRWVLAEACRQTMDWRERLAGGDDLAVSVNVSTRQVRRPGLIEDVEAALADSGLAPEHLTLEITESVLARRREELTSILEDVTSSGVRLALDDFGTGYSSLSLLQDLPVHTLKVDRSFVQSIEAEGGRAPFVRAIVELAEALELTVVAEGIEERRPDRRAQAAGLPDRPGVLLLEATGAGRLRVVRARQPRAIRSVDG